MRVTTVRDGRATTFVLDGNALKAEAASSKTLEIPGTVGMVPASFPFVSGTSVRMEVLKHKTPLTPEALHRSLARRFSRIVRGSMAITINGESLREPSINAA